jgi:ribosomal protein S18 acetylase RimI-like enzyme
MEIRLAPMTAERYPTWVRETVAGYAAQQAVAGVLPEREARDQAEREFDRLLPEGLHTPGQLMWSAFHGNTEVGYLWLGVAQQADGVEAFVFDVAVAPRLRGRGYGRAIVTAGEERARALGATTIRLNVFGHNDVARTLYDSLGYRTTATLMSRRLDDADRPTPPRTPYVRLEPQTPDQQLLTGYDGQLDVGHVRLQVIARSDGRHALAADLEVREGLRRRGYGRGLVVAVERFCRARGVRSVAVDVTGGDAGARRLLDRLGFEVAATLMEKPLQEGSSARVLARVDAGHSVRRSDMRGFGWPSG